MAMRRFASVLFLLAGFCVRDPAVTPARAQAYAPGFPICLRVYGIITYTDCSYTTLPQCDATASGRAAQCFVNPYPNPYLANSGVVERSRPHGGQLRARYACRTPRPKCRLAYG
jgi:hypothetical protein